MIAAGTAQIGAVDVRLDALPDPADFRDWLFMPTLVDVPVRMELDGYRKAGVPVLHQGSEGSCTGFALATVAHYLLRTRRTEPDTTNVSARMFYEMAKRYDEWLGEQYEGSSARGALKGWHKHGVCAERLWSYADGGSDRSLTNARAADALQRPLGAYFRINQRDLSAMHAALAEVGVLLATAAIHEGWTAPDSAGHIPPGGRMLGGHAFAIVGYNREGFWLQNSWGKEWGLGGCALLTYDDWLTSGIDVWVARLGVPVLVRSASTAALALADAPGDIVARAVGVIRPHLIRLGEDGRLSSHGLFGTSEEDVERIFADDFTRLTKGWSKKRLLFFFPSGLNSEQAAAERIAQTHRQYMESEIYPLFILWEEDFARIMRYVLEEALRRRLPGAPGGDEGRDGEAHSVMQPRLDDALEPLARQLTGRQFWQEYKQRGSLAVRNAESGMRALLKHVARLLRRENGVELHAVAHSLGASFLAPTVPLLAGGAGGRTRRAPGALDAVLESCTLWAPALTLADFRAVYLPAIEGGGIRRFALYTLNDEAERLDNVALLYRKSLLYLISNAFEERFRIPLLRPDGEPLLGMEKFILQDPELYAMLTDGRADWVLAPNGFYVGSLRAARAQGHAAFDGDEATLLSTIARIRGVAV